MLMRARSTSLISAPIQLTYDTGFGPDDIGARAAIIFLFPR
jgi:hypothetical protein